MRAMHHLSHARWAVLAGTVLLAACTTRLVGGLEEKEANRILSVLEEQGIWARKDGESKGRKTSWVVEVAAEDASAARRLLMESGLPKEARPGVARLLESGGIIPTAEEVSGRKAAALGEELSRTIETMTGVVEAQVIISLPPPPAFGSPGEESGTESTASVLVRHRGQASFLPEDIQRLVAGAVAGMKPSGVTVVLNKVQKKAAEGKAPAYRSVGPFLVAPSSRGLFLGFISVLLGCNLVLAALVIVGAARILRKRREQQKKAD